MPYDLTDERAARSLDRLRPRLQALFPKEAAWRTFNARLEAHFPALFRLLLGLYGREYDFFYWLEQILAAAAKGFLSRPPELRALDESRPNHWFQTEGMVGGVLYVDLYADDLAGVRESIPYFKELGLSYLHLMPLFTCPAENSDGGYAVSSFREVNPALGTMAELAKLASELRVEGISLVLDFVFNHTSDEHEWAQRAKAGERDYQGYYWLFPDRTMPDQYERHLREIFPDQAPGSFTYVPTLGQWVWTTFNTFQWDLNYANPAVFKQMLEEMLFLANQGVEVLRLDAVAFIWKELGTPCENLQGAHDIIAAYTLLTRIAAPALIFKSEAIVHPDEVVKYIGRECQISYNPTFMVLLWESLATRKATLLRHTMAKRFALPKGTAWVNYVRCHDDIGWSFADEDAAEIGIHGYDHRRFLNQFYTGRFPGSFARGLPFNFNPRTGDMRISGTLASLAGLESAIADQDEAAIRLAIGRIILLHGMILAAGGIPLLYLGDELGMVNDYSFRQDAAKANDSRWVHRPRRDKTEWAARTDPTTIPGRLYTALQTMIAVRKTHPAFSAAGTALWFDAGQTGVIALERTYGGEVILVLANVTEAEVTLDGRYLPPINPRGMYTDLLSGESLRPGAITLSAYGMVWLQYP